jgi:hypothetical protein
MKYIIPGGAVVAIGIVVAGAWLIGQSRNDLFVYTFRIEYGKMPADDKDLVQWLESQEGITQVAVTREKQWLIVRFDGKPKVHAPDVIAKAETFGYTARGSFSTTMDLKTR